MERIEVSKAANGADMVKIKTPRGSVFCHPAALEPLPPAEYRELASKSASEAERARQAAQRFEPLDYSDDLNDSDPYGSVAEQFAAGSAAMFGGEPDPEPKQPDARGAAVLGTIFENTETVFSVEL